MLTFLQFGCIVVSEPISLMTAAYINQNATQKYRKMLLLHLRWYPTARACNKFDSVVVVDRFSGKCGRPRTLRESRNTKKKSKLQQFIKTGVSKNKNQDFCRVPLQCGSQAFFLSSKQAHPKFRALNFCCTHGKEMTLCCVEPDSSSASLGCSCAAATLWASNLLHDPYCYNEENVEPHGFRVSVILESDLFWLRHADYWVSAQSSNMSVCCEILFPWKKDLHVKAIK